MRVRFCASGGGDGGDSNVDDNEVVMMMMMVMENRVWVEGTSPRESEDGNGSEAVEEAVLK